MALPARRRRPGALLPLLLVGLALAASFSCAHAVRVPAALRDVDTEAAHRRKAPASRGTVPLEHAIIDGRQVHEHVSEEVMHLSSGRGGISGGGVSRSSSGSSGGSRSGSGSGGGSRSGSGSKGGGGSRGGGSRSGGGSKRTANDDDDSVLDLLDYDGSSAGAYGAAWKAGVAATVLAVAWL